MAINEENRPKIFLITPMLFLVVSFQLAISTVYGQENFTFLKKWGLQGVGDGEFMFPQLIGIDKSDKLYILDNTGRIQQFDSNGTFMGTIIAKGPSRPVDGALDSMGNVFVLSNTVDGSPTTLNGTVNVFDRNGIFIQGWGIRGTGQGQFNNPLEVAIDTSDNVYVADSSNQRIQKFDRNGTFIQEWGTGGTGEGEFNIIHGLALDSSDNVYVADAKYTFPGKDRIQKFDRNGTFIQEWGTTGKGNGELNHPMAITVDSLDNVYVADALNHRIQKFDRNGTFITSWGTLCDVLDQEVRVNSSQFNQTISGCVDSDGSGPLEKGDGQFQIPVSVAVDSKGNVYVSDFTSRIQKFGNK